MAGNNHPIITKRLGDKPAAVIAGIFILMQLIFPGPARCGYRIDTPSGEILTQAYWITGDKIYLFEETPPIELSTAVSIKKESLSPLEIDLYQDALTRFFIYSTWLVAKQDEILALHEENLQAMKAIDELRASQHKRSEIKKAVKALSARLEGQEEKVSMLKERWSETRIPEYELILARDVKYIQLLSLRSSIQQCLRYLKTWDPTCREYALELYGQVSKFEKSFYDALVQPLKRELGRSLHPLHPVHK